MADLLCIFLPLVDIFCPLRRSPLGCGVVQIVVRRLAARQVRVSIPSRGTGRTPGRPSTERRAMRKQECTLGEWTYKLIVRKNMENKQNKVADATKPLSFILDINSVGRVPTGCQTANNSFLARNIMRWNGSKWSPEGLQKSIKLPVQCT